MRNECLCGLVNVCLIQSLLQLKLTETPDRSRLFLTSWHEVNKAHSLQRQNKKTKTLKLLCLTLKNFKRAAVAFFKYRSVLLFTIC